MPTDPFLAFLDTRPEPGFPDLLTSPTHLGAFGVSAANNATLAEARALRDELVLALLHSESADERRARLDGLVEAYALVPQLTAAASDRGCAYRALTVSRVPGLVAAMLGRAVDLERQGALDHLRVCAAEECVVPFLDTSPSHRRSFCSPTCATRTRVRRHRQQTNS